MLRRLAVAAREGRTWGVLWRRPGVRAQAIAAPLRLALDVHEGDLAVRVVKRRGGDVAQPVMLDVAARWSTGAPPHAQGPEPMLPPLQATPRARDPRTSAGHAFAQARQRVRRAGAAN